MTTFFFQVSQSQIEESMKGMMESKNRLAFEKGSLQVNFVVQNFSTKSKQDHQV